MQIWQDKTHDPDMDTEVAVPMQKAPTNAAAATRIPAWVNASGEHVPADLQAKLTVNQPGDVYEQEADQIAEQVIYTADGTSPAMRKDISVMSKVTGGERATQEAPPIVQQALSSGGQPLEMGTQETMGERFGTDFSHVRVHADEQAEDSAQAIHARAYTVGSDVVFGEGQYQPGTREGQRLLAHELTHVVQQGARRGVTSLIQRDDAGGDAFDQFKITAADLKKPEITTKLNSLSRTELLNYKGKVADPKVKAYIDKMLEISTPLSEIDEDVQIGSSGSASLKVGDVDVIVKPDTRTADPKLKNGADTTFRRSSTIPAPEVSGGKITAIKPPKVKFVIQTTYGPGATGEMISGYGRGTKQEEKDAGKTTLRYHEGGHGLDFIRYLRDNPLPEFTGQAGMTVKEFQQAQKEFEAAMKQYEQDMKDYSTANTDCVGVTIDDFNHVHSVQCK